MATFTICTLHQICGDQIEEVGVACGWDCWGIKMLEQIWPENPKRTDKQTGRTKSKDRTELKWIFDKYVRVDLIYRSQDKM
jgi:hypothetical protein